MPTEKQITRTAKVANTDLSGRFFFGSPADGSPPTMADLYFRLEIPLENGETDFATMRVNDVLSAGDRTSLNGLLIQLRDQGFINAGYTTT